MTTFYEYDRIKRQIERASNRGMKIIPSTRGVSVEIDPTVHTQAAEHVIVFSSNDIEDCLLFTEGAIWLYEFLRLSRKLKDECSCNGTKRVNAP